MSSDGTCRICGKTLKNNSPQGNKSHSGKHVREFAEETGYSKHTDYELIVAFYKSEKADNWAREIMKELKDADRIPKETDHKNLARFEEEGSE